MNIIDTDATAAAGAARTNRVHVIAQSSIMVSDNIDPTVSGLPGTVWL
jgi:hypothetical protein